MVVKSGGEKGKGEVRRPGGGGGVRMEKAWGGRGRGSEGCWRDGEEGRQIKDSGYGRRSRS